MLCRISVIISIKLKVSWSDKCGSIITVIVTSYKKAICLIMLIHINYLISCHPIIVMLHSNIQIYSHGKYINNINAASYADILIWYCKFVKRVFHCDRNICIYTYIHIAFSHYWHIAKIFEIILMIYIIAKCSLLFQKSANHAKRSKWQFDQFILQNYILINQEFLTGRHRKCNVLMG